MNRSSRHEPTSLSHAVRSPSPFSPAARAIVGASVMLLLTFAGVATSSAAPAFRIEPVQTTGNVGSHASLALDAAGTPHIAYFDATQQMLYYATKVNGAWVNEPVAGGVGFITGESCSIALDSTGVPWIAFYFHGSTYGNGPAVANRIGGIWTWDPVTQIGNTGQWISLVLDSADLPHVSYYDADIGALRYATISADAWTIQLVDDSGDAGQYSAIDLAAFENPVIAYHEATTGEARFAYQSFGVWTHEPIATGRGDTWGLGMALAVSTHSIPHVAFYRYEHLAGDYEVTYAARSGGWTTETVDSSPVLGDGISIVLDGEIPHVAYCDDTGLGGQIRYAVRQGVWTSVPVAESGSNEWPSLALNGSLQPRIAFQNETSLDLEYATVDWTDVTPVDLSSVLEGTGIAWGDYDGDGWDDLYVVQSGDTNRLLENFAGQDLFDITSGPEGGLGGGRGAAWSDFDNDEYLDLYVASDPEPNLLLQNIMGASFNDVTAPPLDQGTGGSAVSWIDYDGDGRLDLYLSNQGQANLLVHNESGGFSDVTPGPLALVDSEGIAWGDADGDGDLDLFLGTSTSNKLLRNDGSGFFVDVSGALCCSGPTRGAAWGDYDNDGDLDLYVSQADSYANKLWRNDGGFAFTDVTSPELANAGEAWDVAWIDYDNDADLDLFVANYGSDNKLLRNDGAGVWTDVTHGPIGDAGFTRGAAWDDYDGDGDVDLAFTSESAPARLVRNDVENGNHWLEIDLRGTASNRYGIGARIEIITGGLTQIREVTGGEGYYGRNSITAEFGLGAATTVDLVQVTWPSGTVQNQGGVSADQRITIIEQTANLDQNAWTLKTDESVLYATDVDAGFAAPFTDPLGGLQGVTHLTAGPGDLVYALGDDMGTSTLYTIDPTTSSVTSDSLTCPYLPQSVAISLSGVSSIAFDPLTQQLYTAFLTSSVDVTDRWLGTVDPQTAWIKPLGETTFVGGSPAVEGLTALAFTSDGRLYGIDVLDGASFRFWEVDLDTNVATLLGSNDQSYSFADDMAFLGDDELWVELGNVAFPTFSQFSLQPGSVGTELKSTVLPTPSLAGLAGRLCTSTDPRLVAEDAPNDGGGRIQLDWSAYTPPPDLDHYEILRSIDPCVWETYVVGLEAGVTEFIDTTAQDYVAYYYGLRAATSAAKRSAGFEAEADTGAAATLLVAGPVTAYPNLLINEFAPSGGVPKRPSKLIGEKVEIRNLATVPIGLLGFRLSNGPGPPTPDEEALPDVTIPAGGLYVHTLAVIDLPDAGGTLSLLPPSSSFPLDIVGYGTQGGAPTVPAGFTVQRVEGTTETDPDATSFEAGTSTLTADNTVPAPDLGNSLLLNEVLYTDPGNDYVEVYNPLGTVVNLSKFAISDGETFLTTLTQLLQMQPGDLVVLDQNAGTLPQPIQSPQLYLYKVLDTDVYQRIDQLGWSGGPSPPAPTNDALLRVPDGAAVYLGDEGTNWAECGGGTSLLYGSRSPGLPNVAPGTTTYVVDSRPGFGDFDKITDALMASTPGTRILVKPGTYAESIILVSGVEIVGLSSSPDSVVITGGTSGPAVTAAGVDASTRLAGVAIVGTTATNGAALMLTNSSPLVRNVHFKQNTATNQGGAVYIAGADGTVFEGCLFQGNQTLGNGGAIAVASGQPTVRSSLFVGNSAAGAGGGLYNAGGNVLVEHCVFDQNAAAGTGAGILHSAIGTIDAKYSTVTNSPDGSPLMAEGTGAGIVDFACGDMYGYTESFKMATTGVETTQVVLTDPGYCDPAKLNYAYGDESPLMPPPTGCAQTIGIAGPPCLLPTSVPIGASIPRRSHLLEPAPNPFNPATVLAFELERGGRVWLGIFDLRGRKVAELVNGQMLPAGPHRVVWQGTDHHGERVASGVYLAQLRVGTEVAGPVRKLLLLK